MPRDWECVLLGARRLFSGRGAELNGCGDSRCWVRLARVGRLSWGFGGNGLGL
jgi:hypothetical protein